MSVKKYRLTLTEEQARIVSKACEFYARVGIGQYREIIYNFLDPRDEDFMERREQAEKLLSETIGHVYPDLGYFRGESYWVGFDERLDKAFDVHQVLRHALRDERTPWNLQGGGFAECQVIEEER